MPKVGGITLAWPGKFDAAGERLRPPTPSAVEPLRVIERWRGVRNGRPPVDGVPGRDGAATSGSRSPSLLVLGDNLHALVALSPQWAGEVNLVVMDPPFSTGTKFVARRPLGEETSPRLEVPAFDDAWPGGLPGFLRMMDPRLQAVVTLLRDDASLYVHVDPIASAALRLLLDELLGDAAFMREIVWRIGWVSGFKSRAQNWIRNHDTILFYVRDRARFTFHRHLVPHVAGYRRRGGPRTPRVPAGVEPDAPAATGIPADDVWNGSPEDHALIGDESLDSIQIKSLSREKTGWATQKPEALLARIILASSNEGDLCLDPFVGAGTSVVAAARLGRRFVGIDASPLAIALTKARLSRLAADYDVALVGPRPPPAALSFVARAQPVAEGWCVTLHDLQGTDGPEDAALPPVWHGASAVERLEAWAIGVVAEDGAFEPFTVLSRSDDERRGLPMSATAPTANGVPVPTTACWIVRGWDALGRWIDVPVQVADSP